MSQKIKKHSFPNIDILNYQTIYIFFFGKNICSKYSFKKKTLQCGLTFWWCSEQWYIGLSCSIRSLEYKLGPGVKQDYDDLHDCYKYLEEM